MATPIRTRDSFFTPDKDFNPSSANPTKWPKTLKQFVSKLPTNCLSVFGHFLNLALKGLLKNVPDETIYGISK